jgi:hypothetical protein
MDDLWGVLLALAVIVLPLALAGWLLGRSRHGSGERDEAPAGRGKMPPT